MLRAQLDKSHPLPFGGHGRKVAARVEISNHLTVPRFLNDGITIEEVQYTPISGVAHFGKRQSLSFSCALKRHGTSHDGWFSCEDGDPPQSHACLV